MNDEVFSTAIRKYLRQVGISSHQAIERAVRAALDEGNLSDQREVAVSMTLEIPKLRMSHKIEGKLALE